MGRQPYADQTEAWQLFLQHSAHALRQHLGSADPFAPDLIQICMQLLGLAFMHDHAWFPPGQSTARTAPWDDTRSIILDKLKHRAACKRLQIVTQGNVLKAWFHRTRFQVLRKIINGIPNW